MEEKSNAGIIASILIGTLAVAGVVVYFGLNNSCDQFSKEDLKAAVIDGFTEFVNTPQPTPQAPPSDPSSGDNAVEIDVAELIEGDAVLGDKNAPLTIVEFSDFQCPYCAKFYNEAYQDIKKNYVDTGKVNLVFKDFPLEFHAGAYPASLAAACVGDQKGEDVYYQMHDKIFANNTVLNGSAEEITDALASYAEEFGADMDEYNDCFDNDKFKDEIYADMADAQSLGINGTPSFVINGNVLVGAQPFSVFEKLINEALSE